MKPNSKLVKDYRDKIINKVRDTKCFVPEVWDVIGITEREYYENGSAYTKEITSAERALYQVRWAWILFGWKICGIDEYDKILNRSERTIPRVKHNEPSRAEREYKGGFGSPVSWNLI